MNDIHKYDRIINLPHHTSRTHPPMDRKKRAAQFSPYAALVGHQEQIQATEKSVNQSLEQTRKAQIILENDQ